MTADKISAGGPDADAAPFIETQRIDGTENAVYQTAVGGGRASPGRTVVVQPEAPTGYLGMRLRARTPSQVRRSWQTPIRSVRCGECGRGFRSTRSLEFHRGAAHGGTSAAAAARRVSTFVLRRCADCGKAFGRKELLDRHACGESVASEPSGDAAQTAGGGESAARLDADGRSHCPHCERSYSTRWSLQRHLVRHAAPGGQPERRPAPERHHASYNISTRMNPRCFDVGPYRPLAEPEGERTLRTRTGVCRTVGVTAGGAAWTSVTVAGALRRERGGGDANRMTRHNGARAQKRPADRAYGVGGEGGGEEGEPGAKCARLSEQSIGVGRTEVVPVAHAPGGTSAVCTSAAGTTEASALRNGTPTMRAPTGTTAAPTTCTSALCTSASVEPDTDDHDGDLTDGSVVTADGNEEAVSFIVSTDVSSVVPSVMSSIVSSATPSVMSSIVSSVTPSVVSSVVTSVVSSAVSSAMTGGSSDGTAAPLPPPTTSPYDVTYYDRRQNLQPAKLFDESTQRTEIVLLVGSLGDECPAAPPGGAAKSCDVVAMSPPSTPPKISNACAIGVRDVALL